jgi:PAS domain S-box-containing protein
LTTRVDTDRRDEIGELSLAFTSMQRALKGRLDDLSLLLTVGQDISTSLNINQSMPIILQGALRGTGASAARAVILNPAGPAPLSFAEGPVGAELAALDRSLMAHLRQEVELVLNSPRQLREFPALAGVTNLPIKALFAVPLRSQNKFQGVFFVGYRQARDFSNSEGTLLHTLAGQATMLVENAHLFANAEGGRQRLAAVLASTTEAVIVTDQTQRIFIINGALEQAFKVSTKELIGRSVADVIPSEQLVLALTQKDSAKRNLKIDGRDGRAYHANVSSITSEAGKVMGQVAVLHDVTQLKEINSMKSDFVNNVSHDLRTPLTVVSGLATALAMSDNLLPEQKEYTDNIVLSVERIVSLVDNLLDLGRIEAGVDLLFEDVDVAALLDELADEHWLFAHESGVKLRIKVAAGLPHISADRTLLYQAVANLL